MNNEFNNMNAVELSDDELDTVNGGLAISFGDIQGFASDASNSFSQKNLAVGQQTFAGPGGSGTASMTSLQEIFSTAGQGIAIG
ncbi:MAG: CTB family bacteriocin [Rivularia sp. (in: cyanobacteria)]